MDGQFYKNGTLKSDKSERPPNLKNAIINASTQIVRFNRFVLSVPTQIRSLHGIVLWTKTDVDTTHTYIYMVELLMYLQNGRCSVPCQWAEHIINKKTSQCGI